MRLGFTDSLASGPHALLAKMVGDWQGRIRTWFEPDVLADDSPIQGSVRSILAGRFVQHEYSYTLQHEEQSGLCIHGFDLQRDHFIHSWLDSAHTGSAIMFSSGVNGVRDTIRVLGSYPDSQGGPDWGWRTEVNLPDADKLVITHINISPQGKEARAVEITYERVGSRHS